MPSFDKLDCGFALSYSAVSRDEYALAVDLDKHTVTRYLRSKLHMQERDERRHEVTGVFFSGAHRNFRYLDEYRVDLVSVSYDDCYGVMLKEIGQSLAAKLLRHLLDVHGLRVTDYLYSFRVEVPEKSRKNKSRSVYV